MSWLLGAANPVRKSNLAAKPTVSISHVEEPFADEHGQRWSPAEVSVSWPAVPSGLGPPWLKIGVVVPVRDEMTMEQFRTAVVANALDVMSAALLRLEDQPRRRRARKTA